jgi:ACS family pantothenate transporter-like MFS transporter
MTLLGNWYQPAELGKRACIFQASSSAAQMFSGYLQAALYSGMNGKGGLPAWKWLFIFDGIIGIPIALYGFWAIPDAPTTTRSRYINPEEKAMAIERMEAVGRKPAKPLTVKTFKAIFTAWPVYLFTIAFIAHVLGIRIYSYFNVWLKSTKRYTVEEVNLIPTAGYGLQIAFTLSYAWTSDAIRMRWPVIIFACLVALTGCIILSIYPEHNIAAMMAGWFLTFCETGAGALFITWINEVCSFSQEHRLVVIAIVETMSFTFNAWVPLLAYNTGEAPKFRYGYKLAAMFFAMEICMVGVILLAQKLKWSVGDEAEREVVEEESTQG